MVMPCAKSIIDISVIVQLPLDGNSEHTTAHDPQRLMTLELEHHRAAEKGGRLLLLVHEQELTSRVARDSLFRPRSTLAGPRQA